MDESGQIISNHESGEVVARGPNIFKGYDNAPTVNAQAFINGWLRTGDMGYFDDDGYLYITGRIKELINRGGVKISPYEVEEALLSHTAVLECAVFSIPDQALGETVGAAVILRPGADMTADGLRIYLLERLSYYKVPTSVFFVEELPRTSTGKIQRLKMAEKLGIHISGARARPAHPYIPLSTEIEKKLGNIWSDIFHNEHIGAQDDFFALGGDSLKASHMLTEVERRLGVRLPLNTVFLSPVLGQLAQVIENNKEKQNGDSLIRLRQGDREPTLFCLHNMASGLSELEILISCLSSSMPVYGLQPEVIGGTLQKRSSIEAMASYYITKVKEVQPEGPYHLLGYCFGGAIAYEMARQLRNAGEKVGFLGLIEYKAPGYRYARDPRSIKMFYNRCKIVVRNIVRAPAGARLKTMLKIPRAVMEFAGNVLPRVPSGRGNTAPAKEYPDYITDQPMCSRDVSMRNYNAFIEYAPGEYGGMVTLFISYDTNHDFAGTIRYDRRMGWEMYVNGAIKTILVPGDHSSIVKKPDVVELAREIDDCLANASGLTGKVFEEVRPIITK